MTIQDRLKAELILRGWTVDEGARSRKYITMRPPTGYSLQSARFYLGKSGSCRFSKKGTVATAYPVPKAKADLLRGDEKCSPTT